MILVLLLTMIACRSDTDTQVSIESTSITEGQDTSTTSNDVKIVEEISDNEEVAFNNYYFVFNDVIVEVDADMDSLKEVLDKYKSVFEAPSCAGEGISYLYDYSSFEIETYPSEDGINRIGYIYLTDDTISTSEGIDLSMKKEDVILIYGEEYEEFDNTFIYEKEGTKLCFIFEEEQIIAIEYRSAIIG